MKFGVRRGLGKHLVQPPGWTETGSKSREIPGLAQGLASYWSKFSSRDHALNHDARPPLPYETQFLLIEVYGSIYDILYFVNTQILKQVKWNPTDVAS